MTWGTVDLIEILWTLSALPGLVVWLLNRVEAGRSRAVMVQLGYGNGRLLWAQFSVLLTNVFSVVELVFVLVGVVAMVWAPNPDPGAGGWIRPAFTIGLIGASVLITFVAWRWRAVDRELVERYRQRRREGPERKQP